MKRRPKTAAQIVGEILKEIRDDAKLTQSEMAARIGYDGATAVSRFETGERRITFWKFVQFCQVCEQDPSDVLEEVIKSVPGSFFPSDDEG